MNCRLAPIDSSGVLYEQLTLYNVLLIHSPAWAKGSAPQEFKSKCLNKIFILKRNLHADEMGSLFPVQLKGTSAKWSHVYPM